MTPQEPSTQLPSIRTDKRGVSPVIGVILMVAIVVILAAVIGVFVLGQETPEVAPNADTSIDTPVSGTATITLERTDSSKKIHVIANGATHGTVTNTGDTVDVTGLSDGDQIKIVYYGEQQSHVIQTHTYNYASTSTVSFTCDASTGKLVVSKSAGSDNCEYSTIQNAVDNASAGDTIQVYDGTYDENVLTVNKQLTIVGESKTGVKITSTTAQNCPALGMPCNIQVSADGVTFKKLTLDNTGVEYGLISDGTTTTVDNLLLTNANIRNALLIGSSATVTDTTAQNGGISASGDSTIRNNKVSGSTGILIRNSGASSALVEDNTVTDTETGIIILRDGSTVRNNIFKNNSFIAVDIKANNTVVEYNTITNNNKNSGTVGIEIITKATGQTIQHNKLVNNGINIRFHAEDTEKYDAADTHTVTDNIIYGATTYDIEEVDDSTQTNTDTAILQQNYWGHNDGANTNADCTPASSRLFGETDVSNPLCTAPTAGATP